MQADPSSGRETALWLALLVCIIARVARPAPVSAQAVAESYESQRTRLSMNAAGLEQDPQPEHKTIRYVRFERRQVLEPDDFLVPIVLPRFASTWTNIFHWLTEQSTVERELLLHAGDVYRQELADESMRNLRNTGLFALVRIVAVKTRDPARVDLLVYTRDLWSLRAQQAFAGAGGTYLLDVSLVELNFLGRGKSLGLRGSLNSQSYSVGQTYIDPRVWQQDLRAEESFDLIFNRRSGQAEGSAGTLRFGRPFYNLAQTTAFALLVHYNDSVARDTRAGRVLGFDADPAHFGATCFPYQAATGGTPSSCLARVWDSRLWQLGATADYRIGQRYKQTFTLGGEYVDAHVQANRETALLPGQAALFAERVLPKIRRDVDPYLRYRLSLPVFHVLTNLSTFGQSESVQLGPRVDGRLGVPLRAYGASSDGLIAHGLIGYVWSERDALFDIAGEAFSRLESGAVVDQRGLLRLRAASASYPALLGRLVLRVSWDVRHNDSQHTLVALGADNGLRGYPAQHLAAYGARRVLGNLEYRSLPWRLESVHIGLVAFYDVGSVYTRLAQAQLHHAIGGGLRVLFPQFNRDAFRIDVGVPLERAGVAVLLSYGSQQVIPLTPAEDALSTQVAELSP
jgi:Omp85 superfamily domain